MNAKKAATAPTFSDGTIEIASLFATDDDSKKLAAEVSATVGDVVKLTSKMKNNCTIEIKVLDYTTGKVVFEVTSLKANDGTGETFYIDSTGENSGTWGSTTATSAS
jgi:hypothetical protein